MNTPIKINSKQLSEVWNLPGCNGSLHNSAGGHCAIGKLQLLGVYNLSPKHAFEIIDNNDISPTDVWDVSGSAYNQNMPIEWDRHIAAFKLALQYAQAEGLIEIEDELAQEYGVVIGRELHQEYGVVIGKELHQEYGVVIGRELHHVAI